MTISQNGYIIILNQTQNVYRKGGDIMLNNIPEEELAKFISMFRKLPEEEQVKVFYIMQGMIMNINSSLPKEFKKKRNV